MAIKGLSYEKNEEMDNTNITNTNNTDKDNG